MIIYKAENTTSKKVYIGQTLRSLAQRKGNHYSSNEINDGSYFHNSLLKYDRELWIWSIIDTALSIEDLNLKEQYWIGFYKSNIREYGYNLSNGGLNNIKTESTRKKISNALKGRSFSEEHKLHIKEKRKNQIFTNETRKKMSENHLGSKHWHYGKSKYIYTLIDPNHKKYDNITNLKLFCNEHKLHYDSLVSLFIRQEPYYKGWQISRIKKSDINI